MGQTMKTSLPLPSGLPDLAGTTAPERSTLATIRSLLPYLWPRDSLGARVRVASAFVLLLAAKGATVLVPLVFARAVDALAPKGGGMVVVPLALVVGYGVLRVCASGFAELRDAVFAAVQQRAVRRIALETFRHLHQLSLRFHLDRRTGGLSRALDRGLAGIEAVLRLAVFNVIPTLIEVVLVLGILWHLFDWRYAALTAAALVGYLGFTLAFTSYRLRIRRRMNETDNEAKSRAIDSLLNYETVKYFGNEAHEAARFDVALAAYERAAIKSQVTLNVLNLGQAAIIALALALIMLMAAAEVAAGTATVGRFVLVNTYLMQLYIPLNMLGYVYREIKQGLVDMEQMFHLMAVDQEVADRPGARALVAPRGEVVFDNVRFGYRPDRPILKGISLRIPPGGSLAVVGPTGAGKSTLSRLLFRFYDVTGGTIRLDGTDIRNLTQQSLRAAIGVVPQDTVLFNDTIAYNIAYGHPGATREEIEAAAKLAQVHDFVMRLPEGYATRVGERGLKLSGGEKQRVAIARTILKNPPILIFDEATSALDTRTELEIQSALHAIARHRTTLTIAHRLSTVVEADQILVLVDGEIAEAGTHAELLARGGTYAQMWALQADQESATAA